MIKQSKKHFGAFPYADDVNTPYYPTEYKNSSMYENQTMDQPFALPPVESTETVSYVPEKEPMTLVSSEGVEAGIYSEDSHELPPLNLDVPVTLDTSSSAPVTQHFETMTATVVAPTGKEPMTKGKKIALGGGLAALGYFLLRK